MRFNEQQEKEIYEFIIKYNSDEEFKERIQQIYINSPSELSIFQICALEELLMFGNKAIYKKFLEVKGDNSESQAINYFNDFFRLYNSDQSFRSYKLEQFKNAPDSLSDMEQYAFSTFIKVESEPKAEDEPKAEEVHEEKKAKFKYDPYNKIIYGTDAQVKETLTNLLIGEFIHKMLILPEMQLVKARQKAPGLISNVDKPFIIEKLLNVMLNSLDKTAEVINERFVLVNFKKLCGQGELAFEEYLQYNTNISIREVYELRMQREADKKSK